MFTNKEETPLVFAALAANTQLEADASFGTVHERETGVLEKFKVKKVSSHLKKRIWFATVRPVEVTPQQSVSDRLNVPD